MQRGNETILLDEGIGLGRKRGDQQLRRYVNRRDGLNGGFMPGSTQADGAMSLAIVAARFVDMRAQRGARQQYGQGKREGRPANLNAADAAEVVVS